MNTEVQVKVQSAAVLGSITSFMMTCVCVVGQSRSHQLFAKKKLNGGRRMRLEGGTFPTGGSIVIILSLLGSSGENLH